MSRVVVLVILSYCFFAVLDSVAVVVAYISSLIEEIKYHSFFSPERQRGSRDLTFPAFAVCPDYRFNRRTFFPKLLTFCLAFLNVAETIVC